jgi:hypothetical protein
LCEEDLQVHLEAVERRSGRLIASNMELLDHRNEGRDAGAGERTNAATPIA